MLERLAKYLSATSSTDETDILVCTATELRTAPDVSGLTIAILDSSSPLADVRDGLDANELGFDPNAPRTTTEAAEEFRRGLVSSRAFIARIDGELAGAGMFNPPIDGVTELVGIATLEPHRGRGVAAAVTARAARVAFESGVDVVFARTDNPVARRVYERLGFRPLVGFDPIALPTNLREA